MCRASAPVSASLSLRRPVYGSEIQILDPARSELRRVDPVLLQLGVERASRNAKHVGGVFDVTLVRAQDVENVTPLHFGQALLGVATLFGVQPAIELQSVRADAVAFGEQRRPFEHVAEFSNVSGPSVAF